MTVRLPVQSVNTSVRAASRKSFVDGPLSATPLQLRIDVLTDQSQTEPDCRESQGDEEGAQSRLVSKASHPDGTCDKRCQEEDGGYRVEPTACGTRWETIAEERDNSDCYGGEQ